MKYYAEKFRLSTLYGVLCRKILPNHPNGVLARQYNVLFRLVLDDFIMQTEPLPRKLLDRVSDRIRVNHYSSRTEEIYVQWIRLLILFYNKRHPSERAFINF